MMSDAEARAVLQQAFAARGLPPPSLSELQGVGAIGRFEGRYGSAFGGANNWGAVQCVGKPPCDPAKCVEAGDSHADGSKYRACFRKYPTPVDGAADLIRELYRRPGVPEAMRAGDATAVARAMRAARYFEAPESQYAKGIELNAAAIAQSIGEPVAMKRGGVAVAPPPKPSGGGALGALAAFVLSLAFLHRSRRR